ncbi:hypothetical protein DV735_g798, partial [Chaetothyriales sp. CBS 134920]
LGSFLEEQAVKGKLLIEHSLGLGPKPNIIPPGPASVNGQLRTVHIGWHPVAGFGGKWFAEKTGLGKMITENINNYPDPTQHWAVLVDDYVHELWMDENLDVIYINEKLVPSDWTMFPVGKTRFNDEALRQAGEMTIHNMRAKRPGYNLISNNCQNFALALLDAIQIGAHKKFATSFAVYQQVTGLGSITDLFADSPIEDQQEPDEEEEAGANADDPDRPPKLHHTNTLQAAEQVMAEHTTKVNKHNYLGFLRRS